MNTPIDSMTMIRKLADSELSLPARLGYVALLLASAGMTAVILSLWLTEPALPLRTRLGFGAMCVVGASWTAFSLWALATRRRLFARDRVISGWLAVAFTSLFVLGASVAAVMSGGAGAALGALATGCVMLACAARVLIGARRAFAALSSRRVELERLLARSA